LRSSHHIGALDLQGAQQRRGIVGELSYDIWRRYSGVRRALRSKMITAAMAREGGHPRDRHRVGWP